MRELFAARSHHQDFLLTDQHLITPKRGTAGGRAGGRGEGEGESELAMRGGLDMTNSAV